MTKQSITERLLHFVRNDEKLKTLGGAILGTYFVFIPYF